ncbi:unnamed protein product, partial [Ectocarpus sp. 6 AP-2014]
MNFPVAAFDGSFVSPSHQNGPRRPGDPVRRQAPNQLRVMVAGESGLGKTTFLNNIFRHLNQGQNPMDQASVVHGQTGGIFGHSKTLKIEEREFYHTTSGGQYYKFFLVDTPGYGDRVNVRKSFQPVVDFIIRGSRRYLAEIKRGNDTPSEDGRTDVCIYFIAAHRCKPIDIEYMKQLSKVVAVIPVIGKSDSMTVDEMFDFKKAIADSAAQANGLEFFTFSERAWGKCLAALNIADEPIWLGERRPPPYAVISSQVDDPNGNAHAPDPAKPLVTRVGEKNREYRLAIASGKPSTIVVVLAVIFTFVAVILAATQVHALNGNEPSTGLADWRELILKIQQVEGSDRIVTAVDSGEETLDVLMKVLMDDRKIWTETSEEAQREAPSGRKAATIGKDPGAKGTDRSQVLDERATQSTGTQTSDSTTTSDDGSSRNSQSLEKTEEPTSSPSTSDPEIESDMPDTSSQAAKVIIEEGAATQEADLPQPATWPAGTKARGSITTPNGVPRQTEGVLGNTRE